MAPHVLYFAVQNASSSIKLFAFPFVGVAVISSGPVFCLNDGKSPSTPLPKNECVLVHLNLLHTHTHTTQIHKRKNFEMGIC